METKSQRMDITQLPRDHDGSFGVLRNALVKAFNYSRGYPRKMKALKTLCKYVYTRITEFEKYEAEMEQYLYEEAEKKAKQAIADAEAAEKAANEKAIADAQSLLDAQKTSGASTGKA